jgi:hypothetical protein
LKFQTAFFISSSGAFPTFVLFFSTQKTKDNPKRGIKIAGNSLEIPWGWDEVLIKPCKVLRSLFRNLED